MLDKSADLAQIYSRKKRSVNGGWEKVFSRSLSCARRRVRNDTITEIDA